MINIDIRSFTNLAGVILLKLEIKGPIDKGGGRFSPVARVGWDDNVINIFMLIFAVIRHAFLFLIRAIIYTVTVNRCSVTTGGKY